MNDDGVECVDVCDQMERECELVRSEKECVRESDDGGLPSRGHCDGRTTPHLSLLLSCDDACRTFPQEFTRGEQVLYVLPVWIPYHLWNVFYGSSSVDVSNAPVRCAGESVQLNPFLIRPYASVC